MQGTGPDAHEPITLYDQIASGSLDFTAEDTRFFGPSRSDNGENEQHIWRLPEALVSSLKSILAKHCSNSVELESEWISLLRALSSKSAGLPTNVIGLRPAPAKDMLDALQKWMDKPSTDSTLRREALYLLVKLSIIGNQLPPSLFVEGVGIGPVRDPVEYGGCADIFKGTYCDGLVAVKRLRVQADERSAYHRKLCQEALIWRQLSHPYILPFLGIDKSTFSQVETFCILSPWMDIGSIKSFLKSEGYNPAHGNRLLYEVASGLAYLHSQKVVHGDINWVNIFVDHEFHARIADFGLSTVGESTAARLTTTNVGGNGTVGWMSPERVTVAEYTRRLPPCDVYAFACLCFAVYTLEAPFAKLNYHGVMRALFKEERPLRPTKETAREIEFLDETWALVEKAWAQEPFDRPSMQEIELYFENLLASQESSISPVNGEFLSDKQSLVPTSLPDQPLSSPPGYFQCVSVVVETAPLNASSILTHDPQFSQTVLLPLPSAQILPQTDHAMYLAQDSGQLVHNVHTPDGQPLYSWTTTLQYPASRPTPTRESSLRSEPFPFLIHQPEVDDSGEVTQSPRKYSEKYSIHIHHSDHCRCPECLDQNVSKIVAQTLSSITSTYKWVYVISLTLNSVSTEEMRNLADILPISSALSRLIASIIKLASRPDLRREPFERLELWQAKLVIAVLDSLLYRWKRYVALLGPSFTPASTARLRLTRILINIAENYGIFPRSLCLSNIERNSNLVDGEKFQEFYKHEYQGQQVAFKHLGKAVLRGRELQSLFHETFIGAYLTHPNLLPIMGIDIDALEWHNQLCLIIPWIHHGSARRYTHTYSPTSDTVNRWVGLLFYLSIAKPISSPRCHLFAHNILRIDNVLIHIKISQVALGMAYLHEAGLVHGDLRGNNVLINEQGDALVSDYGQAFLLDEPLRDLTHSGGSSQWMAPELLNPGLFYLPLRPTEASDVYAFACLVIELHKKDNPWGKMNGFHVRSEVMAGNRPATSRSGIDGISTELWRIIDCCWQQKASLRPPMKTVSEVIGATFKLTS